MRSVERKVDGGRRERRGRMKPRSSKEGLQTLATNGDGKGVLIVEE